MRIRNLYSCHAPATQIVPLVAGCTALVLALTTPLTAHAAGRHDIPSRHDGWAAAAGGTTGGAGADAAHRYTVSSWAGLKAAFADGGDAPKVIRIKGVLDGSAQPCSAFAAPGYDFDRYLSDFDPAVWGYDQEVSGPQEDLRAASAANQAASIEAFVPANTTLVGASRGAGIRGGSLILKDVDNVVLRNLTFEAPLDCFPQWDPTDGDTGNWNSEYDAVGLTGATHVWADHNTFTDGRHPDSSLPSYFGRVYEQHDGLLDMVKGTDYVTASWNVFADHDKTMLIGNSDSADATDAGHLRVTVHHNRFADTGQRVPRVRFGQVDVYNNLYTVSRPAEYTYSIGVGKASQLYVEKNAWRLPAGTSPGLALYRWKDSPVTALGNYVNGTGTDLIAAHNAAFPDAPLTSGAGWTPSLRTKVDNPRAVPAVVRARAGAGKIH